MLPNPLHPAVVHFPIVLAVLLPFFMAGALVVMRRGARRLRAWALPAALAVLLLVSSWAAVQTGQAQEEVVEGIVSERVIEGHEEAAETFLAVVVVLTVLAGIGLAGGRIGQAGRALSLAGALVVLALGARVGHSGGELVFKHGAAAAYVDAGRGVGVGAEAGSVVDRADRDDDGHR